MRHRVGQSLLAAMIVTLAAAPASARTFWERRIDHLVSGRAVGVAVRSHGAGIYSHNSKQRRVPASNEKLLLSMALFDRLGASSRLHTAAYSRRPVPRNGVLRGNLWITGRGDPTVARTDRYARSLPVRVTRLGRLVRGLVRSGIERVRGRVIGSTGYFAHDWSAPGWKPFFPSTEIPLPSALSVDGNVANGRHIHNPEYRAAKVITKRLRARGVGVGGRPRAARAPRGLTRVAAAKSAPLAAMVRYMDRQSSNFFAEMLGKRLGVERFGTPGTISKGARAITAWARAHGVAVEAHDSSGLSYANRVSPRGIVKLITAAQAQPWGSKLRRSLAKARQGTLEHRLRGVRLRAKTGTLDGISALSGWVWLERTRAWAQFSILSRGMAKYVAASVEDKIVRTIHRFAR
jgi:D-alanyl-D-alanine carboxypeptidase